jgi:hypothetical protein
MKNNCLLWYVARGHNRIRGWLSRVDAEIFATILAEQSRLAISGDTLEIGVHHGRSFLVQNLSVRAGELAIAADIFDDQHLNVGTISGRGDLAKFKSNVDRYGYPGRAKILICSSLNLTAKDLQHHTNGLRFVNVDGAHWFEAVVNDLRLAASTAGSDCVIAVDDFFNPDYPEVSAAYYAWLEDRPDFVPFCVSQAKLYLCSPGCQLKYSTALANNKFLRLHRKKKARFLNNEIEVYTGPYGGVGGLLRQYLMVYAPVVFEHLKKIRDKRKGAGSGGIHTTVVDSQKNQERVIKSDC